MRTVHRTVNRARPQFGEKSGMFGSYESYRYRKINRKNRYRYETTAAFEFQVVITSNGPPGQPAAFSAHSKTLQLR